MRLIDADKLKDELKSFVSIIKGTDNNSNLTEDNVFGLIDLQETVDEVYLTHNEYKELLEYKLMYQNLCK